MNVICPMMPQLGVTSPERTLSFYRDVLGFTVNGEHHEDNQLSAAEVQLGPVKIQFACHDGVNDTPEQRRARAGTILFFEVDDAQAFHDAMKARNGKPEDIEIADYWMRMKVFSIHDPDDHQLWFGQRLD